MTNDTRLRFHVHTPQGETLAERTAAIALAPADGSATPRDAGEARASPAAGWAGLAGALASAALAARRRS